MVFEIATWEFFVIWVLAVIGLVFIIFTGLHFINHDPYGYGVEQAIRDMRNAEMQASIVRYTPYFIIDNNKYQMDFARNFRKFKCKINERAVRNCAYTCPFTATRSLSANRYYLNDKTFTDDVNEIKYYLWGKVEV